MLRKLIYCLEFFFLFIFQKLFQFFSYRLLSDIGAGLGWLFDVIGIRKQTAWDNICRSLTVISAKEKEKILHDSYKNLGRTFVELILLRKIPCRRGQDYFLEASEEFLQNPGRPAVFISAHLGNWEWMAKILVALGVRLAVVVRRQSNPFVDRLINRERESCGIKTVAEDDMAALHSMIEAGHSIGLVSDQDFGRNSVPIQFFGRPCFAPGGAEFLTKKFDLPAYTCFAVRENYRQRIFIRSFKQTYDFTQEYTNEIEAMIRRYPEQWLWHHRRWKVHP